MTVDELIEELQKVSDSGGGGFTVKYPAKYWGWQDVDFVTRYEFTGEIYVVLE